MVDRPVFHQLLAPTDRGQKTILDMPTVGAATTAKAAAYARASDAWVTWSPHHETARRWLALSGLVSGYSR